MKEGRKKVGEMKEERWRNVGRKEGKKLKGVRKEDQGGKEDQGM